MLAGFGRRCGDPSDGAAVLGEPVLGVHRAPLHSAAVDLVVQVGTGRLALAADLGDLVTGVDDVTGMHGEVPHVPVDVDVAVGVLDVHRVAESGRGAGPDDDAVRCRVDGR